MESARTYDDLIGRTAYDRDGEKLGSIKEVYYDDATGRPEWVEVKTSIFGGARLVPINGAVIRDDNDLTLAYDDDTIKGAPDVEFGDGHLDADQEQILYGHYGYDWNSTDSESGYGYGTNYATAERFDRDYTSTALPSRMPAEDTTSVDNEVVEEVTTTSTRPKVETEQIQSKARLRKYRWTETETVEVPVEKEAIALEVDDESTRRP